MPYRRRVAAALAPLLLFGALAAAAQSYPPAAVVAARVDSLAKAWIADRGSPAVSIAVTRGGDTLVTGGWGFADLENQVPATAATVYQIGSVTKQFTSTAVMQEVERGRVELDEAIGTYLPSLPAAWKPVTVRQLLNHTSGIPSYTALGPSWIRRWGEEMSPDTLVALTASKPMDFEPGTKWSYNNSGYVVLGMLIEKVTGRTWAEDVVARFSEPLGLPDTRWCDVSPIIPRRAHGYSPDGRGFKNAAFLAMSQPYAAGALCATVGDLARWNNLLHGGKVVSAKSYTAMTTPEGAAAKGPLQYGFALARDTLGGKTMIAHNGGISGFLSENAWFPESRTSVTVLTNTGAGNPGNLMRQVARAALGLPLAQPPKRVALSAAERARYVGEYDIEMPGAARRFSVTEDDGLLFGKLEIGGGTSFELLPYGNHTFGMPLTDAIRIVFTVEGDRATGLTFKQGGGSFPGKRRP
ncbi:MAG: serine hydrolase domain-containing protein [Gemmatimonadales bacterium]